MKVTNVVELRDELTKVFCELRQGQIELPTAAEVNNTAGKILNTIKVELAKAALCGEKPKIKFLGDKKKCLPKSKTS